MNTLEIVNNPTPLHGWGGSGIEQCTFKYISEKIPAGSTMLEIGAGLVSTKVFSEIYNLYSIEQNHVYMNTFNSKYIYAPIKNNWYDVEVLRNELPKKYDIVFVDGPTEVEKKPVNGLGIRIGILKHLDLFDLSCPWIFHDSNREHEIFLVEEFAKLTGKSITYHKCCDGENCDYFAVVE
jgi:hypothetical protein